MKHFVDIETVFSSKADRTVDQLSSLYVDSEYLIKIIGGLLERWLPQDKIFGKNILLKPNWVRHSKRKTDKICLRTHDRSEEHTSELQSH